MTGRILVTPRSMSQQPPQAFECLKKRGFQLVSPSPGMMPSERELIDAIPKCCGWIAGVEPVTPQIIEAASELRVISRNGSGVDNLPLDLLETRGIRVERAIGSNANGVAELTLALMLSGLRHIPSNDRGIRSGEWPRAPGREIEESTVAVLGLGAIGARVADKFLKLGARVVGFDPYADTSGLNSSERFTLSVDLSEVLSNCDSLTLHMPLPPDRAAVLGWEALSKIKSGATIVNTARAGLVDQDAMTDALNSGRVSAYCVDVFEIEPPRLTPLLLHARCISTSHIGGLTSESVDRTAHATVENLLRGLSDAGFG